MSSILRPRPYQTAAIEATEKALANGMRRPAVVLPTGAGKTVVFAHLAARWLEANPGGRVLGLAHRTELIEQSVAKVHAVAPRLSVGIVKAERNQTRSDFVMASVQTLRGASRRRMIQDVGLIIVDECHHAAADSYVQVLRHYGALGEAEDGAAAVGFTATMTRGDEKALGDIWQDVVYTRSISQMIQDGYLVRPYGRRVWVDDFDLGKVRKVAGDYSERDLGRALTDSMAPEKIAEAYLEHAATRPGIVFAPTVESAQVVAEALRAVGLSAAMVWGAQAAADRRSALADFVDRRVQVLVNCMVLTEGTDLPLASCCVVARPTVHQGLYTQMVGRVLRPAPGKDDALVLDITGASQRHSLITPMELFGDEAVIVRLDDEETERDEEVAEDDLSELEISFGAVPREEPEYRTGALASEEVDLFHGSSSMWLRTALGVWFLPAGERYIAIIPCEAAGTYSVTTMHRYQLHTGQWIIEDVEGLGYAMAWAEDDVTTAERNLVRKDRGWRNRKPSTAQKQLAARYGIPLGRHSAGEVSNLITAAMATYRIDPYVPLTARRHLTSS